MIIKTYWQISSSALSEGYLPFEEDILSGPADFIKKIRPAEGIALGHWNQSTLIGEVSALGVCLDVTTGGAKIDWREVELRLKPLPAGRTHWSSKPFFKFADNVVERYGLADLFAERFPDLESFTFTMRKPAPGVNRRLPSVAIPGYVYVIRSPHGFKIGKTVNIKSRTNLFSVKLPFPISVEHYAWFDDYSKAEKDFHREFHEKRLEGEWFNLEPEDIAKIKTQGIPATAEELRSL